MKYRSLLVVLEVAFCAWFTTLNSARAQGTLFTYQGQLISNGVPANGNFSMQFALYNAPTGPSQVGPTLTNAPVGVTNGLFTTSLDFGNVFSVSPLYLEIDVRTNGSTNAFTILTPRQPITSAPYAVQALNAANVTGNISDTQLSLNVPLLNGSDVFTGATTFSNANGNFSGNFSGAATGTFSGAAAGTFTGTTIGTNTGKFIGDGSGVTNFSITNLVGVVLSNPNWQVVQSTAQSTTAGNDYLTTNNALTTLTLPGSQNIGSTVWIAGSGANGWTISQVAGTSILFGALGLPGGQTWTSQATSQSWRSVASSANGLRLIAGIGTGVGTIYYSNDGAQTWHASDASSHSWFGLASSADGLRMAAAPNGANISTSVNGGTNWTVQSSSPLVFWTAIASSANGINLVAAVGSGLGNVYTSTNSGSNWTTRVGNQNWTGVACSSDGTHIAACANGAPIYTSTDSGVTWVSNGPSTSWTGITSSASGSQLAATVSTGNIYTSGDGGITWTPRATSQAWSCITSSADGMNLAAAYSGSGFIYTSSDSGQTWLQRTNGITTFGQNWTSITSSADGSRLLASISTGLLYKSVAATTPGTTGSLSGSQYSNVQLQYIGNGQWMPLSFSGTFTGN